MAHVRLRGLSLAYGGHAVLRNLDLDIAAGEFLVLLGPSGCGKSTLLHSIAGLTDVDSGAIAIGGRDMHGVDPSERDIGMVFQSYALYPTMTVEKNMSFGLRNKGMAKDEVARRVKRAAAMLQLEPLLQRKPAQLSGGQRQRVAIGRALVREASVFLFDEPLSNLDAQLRTELRRELKLLHQQLGSTMIYVTHDQAEAMTLASRIAVMRQGQVQQVGTPQELYHKPANLFVAGFLGAPAMNFIEGRLQAGGRFSTAGADLNLPAHATRSGDAVLGVRPEHLAITSGGALSGTVSLIETMGNHQVVWLATEAGPLSSLVHGERQFAIGERLAFAIDTSQVSLFDRLSGQRL